MRSASGWRPRAAWSRTRPERGAEQGEQVLVVPREADRPGARLDRRPPGRRGRGAGRPSAREGVFVDRGDRRGGPHPQAGHPVPGPARRRALVPDAPDASRRRRAAARPVVDRRRRAPQPGRRRRRAAGSAGSGPRSSSRASCRSSRPSACSTTTRRRSASVHVGIVFVADAAGRPVEIRETDKLTGRSRRPRRSRPSSTRWRPGAAWCSRRSGPEREPPHQRRRRPFAGRGAILVSLPCRTDHAPSSAGSAGPSR